MAFENIVDANYLDIYYGTIRKPDEYISQETLPIIDYEEEESTELLVNNQILLKKQGEELGTRVERYRSNFPDFTIIKILKKENVSKVVFRKDDEILYEQLFYYYEDTIVQPNLGFKLPAILRYEFNSDTEEAPEYYIHKKSKSAHKEDVKIIHYESNNNNLINKRLIDNQYVSSLSENLNGNLITRLMQLFYLGNLILDHQELSNEENRSGRVHAINVNKDTNMNTIINIRNKIEDIEIGVIE